MLDTILLCCLAISGETAVTEYPFVAEVAVERAEVQAGPGRRFYTTDRLDKGTVVEVHRRDTGGWFAIRPPEGSFSWIPAAQVKLTDEPDVAEVVAEDAVSWLGSRTDKVSEHRYVVTLKPGERLQILGEKDVANADGENETWYKIAPPAGEFRWISAREVMPLKELPEAAPRTKEPELVGSGVERSPETIPEPPPATFRPRSKIALSSLSEQPAHPELAIRPATPADEATAEPRRDLLVKPAAYSEALGSEPKLDAVDLSAIERDKAAGESVDGFVPRGSRFSKSKDEITPRTPLPFVAPDRTAGNEAKEVKPAAAANPVGAGVAEPKPALVSTSANALTRTELDAKLTALDSELTVMVARDPKSWDLPSIRAEADKLIDESPTPADRGRVRLLIDKIHQFATTFNVEDDPKFAKLPTAEASVPQTPQALDPKYDGVGWLKPVISRERPAAPYALVDSDGRPVAFVTPAPGMNLNRYLNKPLGVYGRRGIVEALNTPHIVVERVIDLGRHLK